MNAMKRIGMATAALGLIVGSAGQVSAGTVFNTNATEWSSHTVSDPANGIIPIGGSGQVNGGFVVVTGNGDEIDLRAVQRGVAAPLPQTNDGITATYTAPLGPVSGHPTYAKWNFDFGIDLRGSGRTIADYSLSFTTLDPSGHAGSIDLLGKYGSTFKLLQDSQNPGFAEYSTQFPTPTAPGVYGFVLTLTPSTFTGDTLVASINVNAVPEPSTLISGGIAGLMGLGYGWRRRKAKRAV